MSRAGYYIDNGTTTRVSNGFGLAGKNIKASNNQRVAMSVPIFKLRVSIHKFLLVTVFETLKCGAEVGCVFMFVGRMDCRSHLLEFFFHRDRIICKCTA